IGNLRPGVPAGLAAMIERLMAKRPEDRYQAADELLSDLARWRASGPVDRELSGPGAPREMSGEPIVAPPDAEPVGSSPPLVPASPDGNNSQIRASVTGIPTFLLYLLPVMGALVLGGVALGIHLTRERSQRVPAVLVDRPAAETSRRSPGPIIP